MMRGGGETQHLAWMRALIGMGIEIDIITGRPLLQRPLYQVDDIPTTVLRSPYMRDLVYKVQGRRVVGRLGSMALHADEELFSRLAWARIAARPIKPHLVLAHAVHRRAGGRLPAGTAASALHQRSPCGRRVDFRWLGGQTLAIGHRRSRRRCGEGR
jgi:hypothetical protein